MSGLPTYRSFMTNGGKKSWRSQTENALLPWTIATMAGLLAIVLGIVAGIESLELQDHHLHIDPTGPNWADIVTAFSTLLLAVAAVLALFAIVESRRARNAVQMTELSRRWDEETRLQVRRKVCEYAKNGLPRRPFRTPLRFGADSWTTSPAGPYRLRECVSRLKQENAPEYRELLTEPNFLEDLAILIDAGGIDFKIVNQSLGPTISYRWSLWKPSAYWLRDLKNDPRVFRDFELLAKRIAAINPDAVNLDPAGEVIWDGFKE
jgi:hypothetical protein